MGIDEKLALFKEIRTPDPEDMVIGQIRELVAAGGLRGGDRLPSERRLEDRFKVPRGVISRAFRRLESYGILRTVPQSGTYIAELSPQALDGLIANAMTPGTAQLGPLMEVRSVLETYAAELALGRCGDGDLRALGSTVEALRKHVQDRIAHYDEDMVFHLKLAALSGNPVLKSELTKLIVTSMELLAKIELGIPAETLRIRLNAAADEHEAIAQALEARDRESLRSAIAAHFASAASFLASCES